VVNYWNGFYLPQRFPLRVRQVFQIWAHLSLCDAVIINAYTKFGSFLLPFLIPIVSRKELFRIAAENLLITDVRARWAYHEAHNKTSHVNDQQVAAEIFARAEQFHTDAQSLLQAIEERND
jgi:hypothetical protein